MLRWGLVAVGLALAGAYAAVAWTAASLPDVFTREAYRRTALQVTRVEARDGTLLGEFFVERRTLLPSDRLPPLVEHALLAAEDDDFFEHPGVDWRGILRAAWVDLRSGAIRQGGSTITQQLARSFFLDPQRTLARKWKEFVLALLVERRLSKRAILATYADQIYFGHGRYGLVEAARFYTGRTPGELSAAQAAMLAGLIRSPEHLSPFRNPDACRARRDAVLRRMAALGWLDDAALARALREPLPAHPHDARVAQAPAWFLDEVRARLVARLGPGAVRRGGYRVVTTLDVSVQRAVDRAVVEGLPAVDAALGLDRPPRPLSKRRRARLLRQWRRRRRKTPLRGGLVLDALVTRVHADEDRDVDLGVASATLPARWTRRPGCRAPAGSVVPVALVRRESSGHWLAACARGPQAALVVIDTGTGAVRALRGGERHDARSFDRAVHARRQAGSTFKVFVLAEALRSGAASLTTTYEDRPLELRGAAGKPWKPRNFGDHYRREPVSVADAVVHSINSVAIQLARDVGPARIAALAHSLGIRGPLPDDLSLALGSAEVTPLELAAAFAAFANGGRAVTPHFVDRVLDRSGHNVWPPPPRPRRVLPGRVAKAVAGVLRRVVTEGTGRAARGIAGAAGKTGTTNDGVDNWFAGWTGHLAAVVWVGHDDNRPLPGGTGGKLAAPLWARWARALH